MEPRDYQTLVERKKMYTKSGLRFSGLAFCVELWTKQVSYRILVPMSYIGLRITESRPAGAFWADNFVELLKTIPANPRRSIKKNALNLVLIADAESTQNTVQIRTRIIDVQILTFSWQNNE